MGEEISAQERALLPERKELGSLPTWKNWGARSRLESARRSRGLRQEVVAEAIGIGIATYRRMEAKKTYKTPVQYLVRCALLFEVPLSTLIDAEDCEWPEGPPRWQGLADRLTQGLPPPPP